MKNYFLLATILLMSCIAFAKMDESKLSEKTKADTLNFSTESPVNRESRTILVSNYNYKKYYRQFFFARMKKIFCR